MSQTRLICPALPNIPWQDRPEGCAAPLWRWRENPIIGRNPLPGVARIFNSAVVPYEDGFIGVFRGGRPTASPLSTWAAARTAFTGALNRRKFRSRTEAAGPLRLSTPTTPGW